MVPPRGSGSPKKTRNSAPARPQNRPKKLTREARVQLARRRDELLRLGRPGPARREVIARLKKLRDRWRNLELRGFRSPDELGLRWATSAPGEGHVELHVTCDLEGAGTDR